MSATSSDVVEITLQRPANGGESVGHLDGRVVFVRGALPGETVRARITDDRHDAFCRAETIEVVSASPHRVPQRCTAAAAGAGCCDLGFVAPTYARELKRDVLLDVLSRVGRLPAELIEQSRLATHGVDALSPEDTGWRVRTRLAVDAAGRPGQRGFHGSTVIVQPCAQPAPAMLDDLNGLAGGSGLTPHAELVIVTDATGGRHVTELASVGRRGRPGADRARTQQSRQRRAGVRGQRVLAGSDTAAQRVADRTWQIPVTGFWQAHRRAPEVYSQTVADMVTDHLEIGDAPAVAWDLYGGAGVFSAALIDRVGAAVTGGVHLVESDARAVAAAGTAFHDTDPLHAHRGEVAALLGGLPAPGVVVLDPPRTGAGAKVVAAISAAAPSLIVHVGCDAARFARDLGLFVEHGYRPVDIRGFDAFPLTHHVEAIAALVPADAAPRRTPVAESVD